MRSDVVHTDNQSRRLVLLAEVFMLVAVLVEELRDDKNRSLFSPKDDEDPNRLGVCPVNL